MPKRWLLLTALALSASSARAQSVPNPAANPADAAPQPGAPASPATGPSAPVEQEAAQAAPDRAPVRNAPAAPVPAPAASPAAVPPAGATYAPPPAAEPAPTYEGAPASAAPAQAAPPPSGGLRPHEVRLASPRLYPIVPRPPRRYGDAGAPFALGLGASFIWRDDIGYELFSRSSRSSAFELFASYDVWAPSSAVVFALGAALRSELHEADDAFHLAHNALQAEATARFMATRWLWPHVRIAAGFMATRFEAEERDSDLAFEDRDIGFVGSLGAGLTLRTPARLFETYRGRLASLSLGVLLEGGYTLASAASLLAKPTASSEIPRDTFAFGELDRGGPYLRVLFVIRF